MQPEGMTLELKPILLRLPFDVLSYIGDHADHSSLLALSLTTKPLRDAVTHHIFSTVYITGTWAAAEPRVELITRSELCALVRAVKISIFVSDRKYDGQPPDRMIPNPSFPAQLRDMLTNMSHINSLTFSIPEATSQLFEDAFSDPPFMLPSITRLTLSPYTHFLVGYCPSLRTVSTYGYEWLHSDRGRHGREHSFALIQAVSHRPLEEFIMMEWWTQSLTAAVLKALPNIPSLTMDGGRYTDPLSEHIPVLSQFKGLKRLQIANAGDLGVGFNPPWCGNAYRTPGVRERVAKQARSAQEQVLKDLSNACNHLEELRFSTYVTILIQRSKDGTTQDFIWL